MNITIKLATAMICSVLPCTLFADDTLYCPQRHGYISLGMTPDQVKNACGEPVSIQASKRPYTQKIPVQQLIYNNVGAEQVQRTPNYINVSVGSVGTGGAKVQVDIVNNKVRSIAINGGGSNAASFCPNGSIQIGDDAAKVYGACGSPALVNNTYENIPIPSATKPVLWIYQPGPNQPSVSLTFVDGKLQSIE